MIRRVIAAVALSLSLTATAHAATLFAGPLQPQPNEEKLHCSIVNVGPHTQNVTIEVYESNGDLAESLGPFALPPFDFVGIDVNAAAPHLHPRVCKFTVPNKAFYRATACIRAGVYQTTCVPAQ